MLTSKHVLGTYTFTNVSTHIFKIRMCLLRTYQHVCQIHQLRVQLELDLGSDWYVHSYSNVRHTMSDNYGATSRFYQGYTVYCISFRCSILQSTWY